MDEGHLRRLPLFASMSRRDCRELARITDQVDVSEGEQLAQEGALSCEFFVIEAGTAEVVRDGRRVAKLGPGEFFGEMGLLEGPTGRRNASVIASSAMTLVVMTRPNFKRMAKGMPQVAEQIRIAVEERTRSLMG